MSVWWTCLELSGRGRSSTVRVAPSSFARTAGAEVQQSRLRRHLTQKQLAARVGLSRSRLAAIEAGNGAALPLTNWFALADTLGRFLRIEFTRDPLEGPTDAGHLDIQQLVIKFRSPAGFDDRMIELPGHTGRGWTDVALVKRAARVLVLIECVNVIGDLGQSFRSSDRKEAEAHQLAAALGGDGGAFMVSGLLGRARLGSQPRDRASLCRTVRRALSRFVPRLDPRTDHRHAGPGGTRSHLVRLACCPALRQTR